MGKQPDSDVRRKTATPTATAANVNSGAARFVAAATVDLCSNDIDTMATANTGVKGFVAAATVEF